MGKGLLPTGSPCLVNIPTGLALGCSKYRLHLLINWLSGKNYLYNLNWGWPWHNIYMSHMGSPCFWGDPLQKTDKKAPISGDPPTCTFMYRSNENENNVEHCGSPADSSRCQAWDQGALCLLRRLEYISRALWIPWDKDLLLVESAEGPLTKQGAL